VRAALALVLAVTGVARADLVELPKSRALLDVPSRWTKLPDHASLVTSFKSPSGIVLAVTRAQVPNLAAWIKDTRESYVAEVEIGALARARGKKLGRKLADINGVPTLDLEVQRTDGTTLVMRILLFRSYALAATLEVPKGGRLDEARAITGKFTAPKP
jgi:hypothetical protein